MINPTISSLDIEKNKELAALSYLWIFSVILFLARRDSPFIKWHARQGVLLFFISIGLWLFPFLRLTEIFVLALMILGFIEAAQGHLYHIPLIGDISEGHFHWTELRKIGHALKHLAIHMVKPEHVTPPFEGSHPSPAAAVNQEKSLEELSLEREEQQIAALLHRVEEDEKKIHTLEEEVKKIETKAL